MPQTSNDKKLTFALLCLANITISFNFAALAAAIPLMSRDLIEPTISVSRVLHYYMIPYGLGALIYAPLVRRLSFKSVLTDSLIMYVLSNFICALSHSLSVILTARIVMGLAAAGIVPVTLIVIGKFFEKEVRGRMVGMFFSMSFMASLAGIALSGVAHWRWLFGVPAGLGAIAAMMILWKSSSILSAKESGRVDYFNVLKNERVRNIFLFIFAISFLYHGVHKWFGVYFDHVYRLNQFAISFYFMLIALSGAVGQNLGGYWTDKKGRVNSTRLGVAVMAVSTMALLGHYPQIVLAILLIGFSVGWTMGHNGVSTVLTDLPQENRSEIASLNSAVRFFSGGLGFLIGGPFVEKDFGLTFFMFGFLMLVTTFFLKKTIPSENKTLTGGQPWLT